MTRGETPFEQAANQTIKRWENFLCCLIPPFLWASVRFETHIKSFWMLYIPSMSSIFWSEKGLTSYELFKSCFESNFQIWLFFLCDCLTRAVTQFYYSSEVKDRLWRHDEHLVVTFSSLANFSKEMSFFFRFRRFLIFWIATFVRTVRGRPGNLDKLIARWLAIILHHFLIVCKLRAPFKSRKIFAGPLAFLCLKITIFRTSKLFIAINSLQLMQKKKNDNDILFKKKLCIFEDHARSTICTEVVVIHQNVTVSLFMNHPMIFIIDIKIYLCL